MLAIQKYILEHGLDKAVEDFKLIKKDYNHKVLLKYNQIESSMKYEEVKDCRGLILEKGSWKIMSLAFRKFFNYGESQAANIDWRTAKVVSKEDGSMIQVYYDWIINEWCVGTTGTANAKTPCSLRTDLTFEDLFWNAVKIISNQTKEEFTSLLVKGFTYAFELCTPYNIVVTPHNSSKLFLLSVRDLETLNEIRDIESIGTCLSIPVVKTYDLSSYNDIIKTFDNMPWDTEGYIVVDSKFNRVKIKNPSYTAMHFLKGSLAPWMIITIIKKNEIEEFIVNFPERKEEILELENKWNNFNKFIEQMFNRIVILNNELPNQKDFALKIQEEFKNVQFLMPLAFQYRSNKCINYKDWIMNYDEKKLFGLISNFK